MFVLMFVVAVMTICSLESAAKEIYVPAGYNEDLPQAMTPQISNFGLQFDKSADQSGLDALLDAHPDDYELVSDSADSSDYQDMLRRISDKNLSIGIMSDEFSTSKFSGAIAVAIGGTALIGALGELSTAGAVASGVAFVVLAMPLASGEGGEL